MNRFVRGLAGLAVLAAALSGTPAGATERPARHDRGFDEPYTGFAPNTRLRPSTPREAGLRTEEIDAMLTELRGFMQPQGTARPLYPGAVVLVGHDGKIPVHEAMGYAVKYADAEGTELPPDQQVAMRRDTIFDMASVTKLFTSIVVMQQVERGLIDLNAPVASYLPEFAANGKQAVTVRQLLTHTSGLPSWLPLWRDWPDKAARVKATLEVVPSAPPDTRYTYSDLNLITLGVLAEHVTGEPLEALVGKGITEPLGMRDTGFNPPAAKLDRIAATEYEANPPRGMVRGSVHDENAWSFGGVAGHAGIFSTASDLAILCQTVLNGGRYGSARILQPDTVEQMLTDYNEAFPTHAHGLGFELSQRFYMGGLTAPQTAGHTGFTGTSVVIDPLSRSFVILLTNRVHPNRAWSSVNAARRVATQRVAQALDVTPQRGHTAWFAGRQDASTATLTLPVELRSSRTRLGFDLFVDSEETDTLSLELSRDGGATWDAVPFICWSRGKVSSYDGTISGFAGRRWQQAFAELDEPPGDVLVRWRYVTDPVYQGRGIYVDDIRLGDRSGTLFDGEKHPERFVTAGWTQSVR
ncbi:serine hydrolase domain-containing protein [Flindersiella endophytica]